MTLDRLARLINPRTVAVIGGGAWCRSVLKSMQAIGFDGALWAVHPNRDEIAGVATVPTIEALPDGPDATFVGVNRTATIEILRKLNAKGAGGAVCFASGFAESEDGADLNAHLIKAAGDTAIIGPNCYGFVNALDGVALWPDVHGLMPVERGVAILTQSSNIALNLSMQQRGLPIGFLGTVGNQAQIGLSQMAHHLIKDPRITALGLYIEGVGDICALQSLMQTAAALGKPVVALKSGQSEAAQSAALSHTASMSGSDDGADALFQRLGVIRVRSLDGLLETLKHAHLYGPVPPGPIASLSCSGGEASLMADGAEARGLRFAPLTKSQDTALSRTLGPLVTRSNPLDYHTFIWDDVDKMTDVYTVMAQGDAAATAIVVDFPRSDRCEATAWDCVAAAGRAARRATGKPVALLATLPECLPETTAHRLMQDEVLPLNGLEAGLEALAALYADRPLPDPNRRIIKPGPETEGALLDEANSKAALESFGADVPRHAIADTPGLAAEKSWDLLPVALKARGLAHKSDMGGVALGLTSTSDVEWAAKKMGCTSYYIEEMVTGAIAELLVAVVADPAHGYVLTLAAGGVLTELWRDTQHLLVPATEAEVLSALDQLRIAPLLQGYRGAPACDRASVLKAVMAVQDYVITHEGRVAEVEINPLIVTPTRAVVADALIRRDL